MRSLEDPDLVARLADDQVPLTVCPMSNIKLGGFDRLEDHPLGTMLEHGLKVSINSDDPAYFGGYVGKNYSATQQALQLTADQMVAVARNSLDSTFLARAEKAQLLTELDEYVATAT